ncbi:MAG: 2-amino-4-hydroxy-6-hydroxymethyldihydropteridine diphosphokinase [Bacteroidales bacterium]|jgi:2-amino-4-hydroxy-6-hydroxymethyldihydropteridine diphosphokinase|nr:2-amino-4-hydroxy-6-hydroxymethyldihydropteridine diphosphokinase [Bacteroidales bacterium]
MNRHIVYIGLGSNLGDGPKNLDKAVALLQKEAGEVLYTSAYIESEPWGFESEHRFTNAVTVISTTLEPLPLLDLTQQIERRMGRTRKRRRGEGYSDRVIDLDLLMYDNLQLETERLILPHPHIAERDFVKLPLEECLAFMRQVDLPYDSKD